MILLLTSTSIGVSPAIASATNSTPPLLTAPLSDSTSIQTLSVSFSLPSDAARGTVKLIMVGGSPEYTRTFTLKQRTAGSYSMSFSPLASEGLLLFRSSNYFSDISTTRDGTVLVNGDSLPPNLYTLTLTYQDANLNSPASAIVPRVLLTTPCGAGSFSSNGGVPVDGTCTAAPIGSYVDGNVATSATACPAEQTTSSTGSTSVEACHRSSTPAPQLVTPLSNAVVTGNLSLQYSLPVQASSGTVKIRIFNSDLSRLITLSNYQSGVQSNSFDPRASDFVLAGANATSFLSVSTTTLADQSHFMDSLPIGNYQVEIQYQDEFLNPISRVSASTVLLTAPCEAGTYSTTGAKDAGGHCTDASVGHYADSPGATHETPCPIGKYAPTAASWRCVDAAPNTYVDTLGASASTACPAHYTSASGSDSLSDCKKPISAIKYCNIKRTKKATATCIATAASKTIPTKAKVSITVKTSDRKFCLVKGGQVLGQKKGICRVTLKITPKRGKATTYTSRIRVA